MKQKPTIGKFDSHLLLLLLVCLVKRKRIGKVFFSLNNLVILFGWVDVFDGRIRQTKERKGVERRKGITSTVKFKRSLSSYEYNTRTQLP